MKVYNATLGCWMTLGEDAPTYDSFDPETGEIVTGPQPATQVATPAVSQPAAGPSIGTQITQGLTALVQGATSLAQQQAAAKLAEQKLAAQTALQQAALAKGVYLPTTTVATSPAISGTSVGLVVAGLAAAGIALFLWSRKS